MLPGRFLSLALATVAALLTPALLASCQDDTINPLSVGATPDAGTDARDGGGGGDAGVLPDGGQGGGGGGSGGSGSGPGGGGGSGGSGSGPDGGGGSGGSGSGPGGGGGSGPGGGGAGDAGDASVPSDAAPPVPVDCDTVITAHALALSPHVPTCSVIDYATTPPTSGPHYPVWAAYQTYAAPVPRGFWVHSLEHGAVVISYNCSTPCDDELAALAALLDARPADPRCAPPVRSRIIVTPDPDLDVRFAASAWGFSLRSNCFDLGFLMPFLDAHYARATEDFCGGGIDPTSPDAGIPATCGEPGDGG